VGGAFLIENISSENLANLTVNETKDGSWLGGTILRSSPQK
jgi:hypothetical protein